MTMIKQEMEMKKPKKLLYEAGSDSDNKYIIGYNQCWEDREAWLKEVILAIINVSDLALSESILGKHR